MSSPRKSPRRAFSLIEVLVASFVLAMLMAILAPSLSRAREQAQLTGCQANLRQLTAAFITYSLEYRDRLPGSRWDTGADWLGAGNQPGYGGREPADGTLFNRYMGRQAEAYQCPGDTADMIPGLPRYSYAASLLLSGAKTHAVTGAHYRESADVRDPFNYHPTGHDRHLRPMRHAPLLVEEERSPGNGGNFDGIWGASNGLTNRHFRSDRPYGKGCIGYVDGHAGSVRLPSYLRSGEGIPYFQSRSICYRRGRRNWVSGLSWSFGGAPRRIYGFMDSAPDASLLGVYHHLPRAGGD
ncbi:MAG: hypothetical protein AMXMBFR13_04180 [Phycisphaerae bacterium]